MEMMIAYELSINTEYNSYTFQQNKPFNLSDIPTIGNAVHKLEDAMLPLLPNETVKILIEDIWKHQTEDEVLAKLFKELGEENGKPSLQNN